MTKERILITVKTYPTLSGKYGETVCTAGVREDGTWLRLYPVPFRRLGDKEKYKLYDWMECEVMRNRSDPRPESFRPTDEMRTVEHMGTEDGWRERRRIITQVARVHDSLDELIAGAKRNKISLGVFKPAEVIKFFHQKDTREWDKKKLQEIRNHTNQHDIFSDNVWRKTFTLVNKLPYNFSYHFTDVTGKSSKLQILEWQIGALYWNCLESCQGNESQALKKVKQTYYDKFIKTDLHFFVGTTQAYHFIAPNPWVIIGVFPVPHKHQFDLF